MKKAKQTNEKIGRKKRGERRIDALSVRLLQNA